MIKQFRVFIFIGLLLTGGGWRSFGQSGPPMPPMPPGPPAPGIIAGGSYAAVAPPSPGGGVPPGTNPPSVYSQKAYSFTNGELGVEITLTPTNWMLLTVHNTESNRYYHLMSRPAYSTNLVWRVETEFYGLTNTNSTPLLVPTVDRGLLFFMAASGEDSDFDGLPDWYERLVTHTSPTNADTGNLGIYDGNRDLAGDGLTVFDKFQSGHNPFIFEISPPPSDVRVTYAATNAVLRWAATRGAPTEYKIERFNPATSSFVEIGRTNALSFVDNTLPANTTPQYRVQAIYSGGGGSATGYGGGIASTDLGPFPGTAAVVRGTNGTLSVAISGMPTNVVAIRVNKGIGAAGFPKFDFYNPIWSTNQYLPNRSFYSASVTNSYFDIAIGQFTNGVYRIPAFEVPFYAAYDFTIQAKDTAGNLTRPFRSQPFNPTLSYYPEASSVYTNLNYFVPFLDGSGQLREILEFYLRGADAYQFPLEIKHPNAAYTNTYFVNAQGGNYAAAGLSIDGFKTGYGPTPIYDFFNELQPFEENYMLRNFAFDAGTINPYGAILTGAYYGETKNMYLFNGTYVFPSYALTTNVNPNSGRMLNYTNTQWILSEMWPPWSSTSPWRLTQDTNANNFLTLDAGFRNTYGLQFLSVKLITTNYPAAIVTLNAGQTISYPGSLGYYFETERPSLQTVGYYFAGPLHPAPGRQWNPGIGFTNGTAQPLLFAAVGKVSSFSGWARQSILNGYADSFAYSGQYFDKAFKADLNGNVTTNETGILSEYGEFFPTEPGKVFLKTKPDVTQSNVFGQATVYAIKLGLDVNHDGTIDLTYQGPDNTSQARPFRFWINNDSDLPANGNTPSDDTRYASPDFAFDNIRSARDLEDFARLWISGLPALPSADGYSVALSWRNVEGTNSPSIKIFGAYESDGGMLYLTDTNIAASSVGSQYGVALGSVQTNQPFVFPANYFQFSGRKHFLFEGVTTGKGELVLTILKNGISMAETSEWIELADVKDLYERVEIDNVSYTPLNTLISRLNPKKQIAIDPFQSKQQIVFVHGWRMTEWDYYSFSESMFKRLYWSGYQGRFASVRWPTLSQDSDGYFGQYFTYNKSEFMAFNSAPSFSVYFAQLRQRLPDSMISVCAHSMGNIAMMEALKLDIAAGRTNIDNYVLMQAAVPAQCYDTNYPNYGPFITAEGSTKTPDTYRGYPGLINRGVRRSIFNFWNTNDYALATGTKPIIGGVSWQDNQLGFKPNTGFQYITDGTNGYHYVDYSGGILITNLLTNIREVMSFVARPRSKAVGAAGVTGGVIAGGDVNLNTSFGFDRAQNEHSAQFNYNAQQLLGTGKFYQTLILDLFLP